MLISFILRRFWLSTSLDLHWSSSSSFVDSDPDTLSTVYEFIIPNPGFQVEPMKKMSKFNHFRCFFPPMLLSNKCFTPVNAKGDCINNVGSVYFVHVLWIPFVCLDFFCQSRLFPLVEGICKLYASGREKWPMQRHSLLLKNTFCKPINYYH